MDGQLGLLKRNDQDGLLPPRGSLGVTSNHSVAQSGQLDPKREEVEAARPFKAYVIGSLKMSFPFILLSKVGHNFCLDSRG